MSGENQQGLPLVEKAIVLSMAKNDMTVSAVAEELHYHWNTINYYCNKLERLYGLNPRKFYDLCKLVEMARDPASCETRRKKDES